MSKIIIARVLILFRTQKKSIHPWDNFRQGINVRLMENCSKRPSLDDNILTSSHQMGENKILKKNMSLVSHLIFLTFFSKTILEIFPSISFINYHYIWIKQFFLSSVILAIIEVFSTSPNPTAISVDKHPGTHYQKAYPQCVNICIRRSSFAPNAQYK